MPMEFLTFIAGLAIGGLLSWLITHRYYIKASESQEEQLGNLEKKLKSKNTLEDFEGMLEKSEWNKEYIDGQTFFIAKEDNTFQIELGEKFRQFTERWTKVYPDPNSSASPVYLKISNNIIKEFTFISMDGGRIFVPMPDIRAIDDETVEYFWNLNSLEVKVYNIVGEFYIYESIDRVAKRSKIEVVQ
ncbi:MAG: hypothetical protein IH950_12095 [Bacteroidetes bacterium]|nr:hypothetical protein [Bacteroidota bacterium]